MTYSTMCYSLKMHSLPDRIIDMLCLLVCYWSVRSSKTLERKREIGNSAPTTFPWFRSIKVYACQAMEYFGLYTVYAKLL